MTTARRRSSIKRNATMEGLVRKFRATGSKLVRDSHARNCLQSSFGSFSAFFPTWLPSKKKKKKIIAIRGGRSRRDSLLGIVVKLIGIPASLFDWRNFVDYGLFLSQSFKIINLINRVDVGFELIRNSVKNENLYFGKWSKLNRFFLDFSK